MPFKVLKDGVTLHYKLREEKNPETKKKVDVLASRVYFEGDIVQESDIAPDQIAQYEKGDELICSLIEKVPTENAGS